MTNRMRAARGKLTIATAVGALASLIAIGPASGRGPVPVYEPGDIIVADSGNDAIKSVDPGTGASATISSNGSFTFPADITFAEDGDIFVVDRDAFDNKGGVIRVDGETAVQSPVTSNSISDAAGGKELLSNPIALDRKGDSLYVTDFARPRKVIKVDIATGKQSLAFKGQPLNGPFGIIAAGLKKPLVSDAGAYKHGAVVEINPKKGTQKTISKDGKFTFPQALALWDDNHVLVTDTDNANVPGQVFSVNLSNGKQEVVSENGPMDSPGGIALMDQDTAVVSHYLTLSTQGGIYTVDLNTGAQTPLSLSGFSNPLGVRVAP
jgi:sugar lactone lactonase YvrE